jgi:hypothetical protein
LSVTTIDSIDCSNRLGGGSVSSLILGLVSFDKLLLILKSFALSQPISKCDESDDGMRKGETCVRRERLMITPLSAQKKLVYTLVIRIDIFFPQTLMTFIKFFRKAMMVGFVLADGSLDGPPILSAELCDKIHRSRSPFPHFKVLNNFLGKLLFLNAHFEALGKISG